MPTPAEREGRDREARTVCLRGMAIMGAMMSKVIPRSIPSSLPLTAQTIYN